MWGRTMQDCFPRSICTRAWIQPVDQNDDTTLSSQGLLQHAADLDDMLMPKS